MRVPAVLTSAIVRRLLLVQLCLALVPLTVLAFFALDGLHQTRGSVVSQSQAALDDAAFTALRQRDVALADDVAAFLRGRESDLRVLATLPRTTDAYTAYSAAMNSSVQTVDQNGQNVALAVPLFREVAFIDSSGHEQAKAIDTCSSYPFSCSVQPATDYLDVSNPANTLYKSESYFRDTQALPAGQIFVGAPIGAYVPYQDAYAGAQNRSGQRYRGVIRFAMPVEGGVVELAVESIHLQEIVAHAAPSNPLPQAEIDPREADLTYMVAPDGWVIAHPRAYNIAGVDASGSLAPSISAADQSDDNDLYRAANLSEMGFIDPSLPQMVQDNAGGQATNGKTFIAHPVNAPQRAIAEATIPFYDGRYNTSAGFGMVVMSTDAARFHVASSLLGKQIDNRVTVVTTRAQQVGAVAGVVALALAVLLALTIARPIVRLTRVAQLIEHEHWAAVDLARLEKTRGGDELSRLTRVFASMAKEIHERIAGLRKQVQQLQVVIDESKREKDVKEIVDTDFFRDLTGKATQMRARNASARRTIASVDRPTGTEG
jgi:hypothetical protein